MTRRHLATNVFDAAVERMQSVYDEGHRVVVSWSGGKDSHACAEICVIAAERAGRLPVEVVMRDEEIMFPGTFELAERQRLRPEFDFHWIYANQPIVNVFNRELPYFWTFDPQLPPEQWVRQPPRYAQRISDLNIRHMIVPDRFPPEPGKRLVTVIGLRGAESNRRLMAVHNSGGFMTKVPQAGAYYARPLYDWQDGDIWLAHQKFGWDYNCNPYEAPILMADLTFKSIGEVVVGDEVVGWGRRDANEPPRRRGTTPSYTKDSLQVARVERTFRKPGSLVTIEMESGRKIRCTPDHQWLIVGPQRNHYRFAPAEVGLDLAHVVDVAKEVSQGHLREAAWLGGIYDGEGHGSFIYQSPTANPVVYARIREVLTTLEIPFKELNGRSPGQRGFRLTGGRNEFVRFVTLCRPTKIHPSMMSRMLATKFRSPDRVVSITPEGEDDVYALETSTGNYIAWGYASKNSAYDVMHRLGVPRHRLRIAPPSLSVNGAGKLQLAAKAWPQWFEKVSARLPGVRTVAMFGAAAITPTRQFGETWEQTYQRECIDDAPKWISDRAKRVQEVVIKRHAGHASTPLPETDPCRHCTGANVSWRKLTKIMYLGDPLSVATDYLGIPDVDPEVFRPGSGVWFPKSRERKK